MSVDAARGETRKPIVMEGLAGLQERAGTELGVSDWTEVVQEDINTFAKLTGDEQYIHVDPERAAQDPSAPRSSTVSSHWEWPPGCSGRSAQSRVST